MTTPSFFVTANQDAWFGGLAIKLTSPSHTRRLITTLCLLPSSCDLPRRFRPFDITKRRSFKSVKYITSSKMSSRMERLRTPSPTLDLANGQLLSPPLTGGLGKRARFAEDPDTPTSKRFARSQKLEECALAGYTDIKESSDEIQDLSDGDASSEKSSSPSPLTSSTSHTDQVSTARNPFVFSVENIAFSIPALLTVVLGLRRGCIRCLGSSHRQLGCH